jgi:transposase
MDYFAGLDVSIKDTSVCIVDDTGRITREVKVASEPDALLAVLMNASRRFKRIGLEAGPRGGTWHPTSAARLLSRLRA